MFSLNLGQNTTPSWILYNHGGVKVGLAAINAPSTGKNLVYDSKRLIGRQFNDDCVVKDRTGWLFNVVRGDAYDKKVYYDPHSQCIRNFREKQ